MIILNFYYYHLIFFVILGARKFAPSVLGGHTRAPQTPPFTWRRLPPPTPTTFFVGLQTPIYRFVNKIPITDE